MINTQPHREALAIENLHRQDFNVYCPMLMKRIRHARRVYEAPRPLFPGYVFVEHLPQPHGQQWRPILGTYGVRSVIRHGDTPALLNGELIERLKAREVAGVIRKPERPFQVGQQVGIRGGPFDGLAGQILEMRENERIVVLIDLLNQRTKVHIGAELLNPA